MIFQCSGLHKMTYNLCSCVCNTDFMMCLYVFFFSAPYNYAIILLCYFHAVSLNVAVFFFPPRRVKCTRCIMQNNSTESPELWTQFCRHPNLKDRETTTWFCGTCSACCGDYFGGRGHCVEMLVGEEKKKSVERNWSHFTLLGSVVEMGSWPPGPSDRDQGPKRISADYISWSGKHANNKCMSNVLVFLLD